VLVAGPLQLFVSDQEQLHSSSTAMKSTILSAAVAAATLFASSNAISILMGNDDGFGSAQLREFYRLLKEDGHDVVVVAPVDNESGQGGRSVFTTSRNLTTASEFNLIPAGSPSLGRDPNDPDIWYYNGTPAACTFVALDFVLPRYYDNRTIDLYVGGPNYGGNAGSFLYTLSGKSTPTFAILLLLIMGQRHHGRNVCSSWPRFARHRIQWREQRAT
jgi:5'-nucleotidase